MLWMYKENQNWVKQIAITFGHIVMVSKLCLLECFTLPMTHPLAKLPQLQCPESFNPFTISIICRLAFAVLESTGLSQHESLLPDLRIGASEAIKPEVCSRSKDSSSNVEELHITCSSTRKPESCFALLCSKFRIQIIQLVLSRSSIRVQKFNSGQHRVRSEVPPQDG